MTFHVIMVRWLSMAIGGELTISFKVFLTIAFWLIGKEKKKKGGGRKDLWHLILKANNLRKCCFNTVTPWRGLKAIH